MFYEIGAELQRLLRTDLGSFAMLLLATITFIAISGKMFKKANLSTKTLVYAGMALALAFILSLFRPFSMPLGGSVSPLSMFFVSIVGIWFGPGIGLVAGVSFGLLRLAANPSIIHPLQLFLDYPLAFGMLGLSGFFSKRRNGLAMGFLVAATGRWLMHTIAGYAFWVRVWPPEGWSSYLLFSMAYNGLYIYAEVAITLIIVAFPSVRKALDVLRRQTTS
ncbi:MAG: energy-coupled thiamine transporter ThiT [Defluviitaleaceae bacterium]|nr:energy-coupled thiamine transporter ThiT [Defluviitaleaceae bacterium]